MRWGGDDDVDEDEQRKKNSAKVKAGGNLHISCTKPSLKQCAGHPD